MEAPPFRAYADYATSASVRGGMHELLELVSRDTCAVMCSEAVWWRCHRRIVADHVLAHDVRVAHIFTAEKAKPATLTPFARLGGDGSVSYPASAEDSASDAER